MNVAFQRAGRVEVHTFWPLIAPGVAEWASSDECKLPQPDGAVVRVPFVAAVQLIRDLLLTDQAVLHVITADDRFAGFDVVRLTEDGAGVRRMHGVVTWLKPELRKSGVWRRYLDGLVEQLQAVDVAEFVIQSTRQEWGSAASHLGLVLRDVQSLADGTVVSTWVRPTGEV